MTPEFSAHLLVLFPIAAVALILPWLGHTRPGILFGVTVPLDFPSSPTARHALRTYRLSVAALCLAVILIAASVLWLMPPSGLAITLTPIVAVFTELIGNLLLWRLQATRIRPHAITVPIERHADLTPLSTTPPVVATLCALLPLAATALWLHLHWSQIPLRWTQHWNASGQADGWATRSPLGIYSALLNGGVFVLVLCAMLLFMARASGPQTSQRRRALVPMAALAWLITGMFCLIGLTPLVHVTTAQFLTVMAAYFVVLTAISVWLMYRGGLILSSPATEPYDSTPDNAWHAGIFYFNKADAAVIVPKRFGLGWTLNFARPSAWLYLGALCLFLAAITLLGRWIK